MGRRVAGEKRALAAISVIKRGHPGQDLVQAQLVLFH
jgi:hypothetical protein